MGWGVGAAAFALYFAMPAAALAFERRSRRLGKEGGLATLLVFIAFGLAIMATVPTFGLLRHLVGGQAQP